MVLKLRTPRFCLWLTCLGRGTYAYISGGCQPEPPYTPGIAQPTSETLMTQSYAGVLRQRGPSTGALSRSLTCADVANIHLFSQHELDVSEIAVNHADAVGPVSLLITKLPQEHARRIVGMYSGTNCTLCDEKKASLITHGAAALFDFYCIPCFTGLTDPAGCQPTVPDQLENEVLLPPGWDDTDFEWEADVDDVSD